MGLQQLENTAYQQFGAWRKHSGKARATLQISSSFAPWTKALGVTLNGLPVSERTLDLLDVAWYDSIHSMPLSASSTELRQDFWANVSQSIQRRPWGSRGTLTTRGVWYSYEFDTTLDGRDFLRLQGLPTMTETRGLSDRETKDLGGEAFCAPIVGSFLAAFYYQPWAVWWKQPA